MDNVAGDADAQSVEPAALLVSGELGRRLRTLRVESGIALRELARILGVTPSAISQIENGAMMPSVSRLIEILNALEMPLAAIFDQDPVGSAAHVQGGADHDPEAHHGYTVSRRGDVPSIELGSAVVYRRLAPRAVRGMDIFESVYPAGAASSPTGEFLVHTGQEVGSVVFGRLTVEFEDESVHLMPGDAISFSARKPHRIHNSSADPAAIVWVTLKL